MRHVALLLVGGLLAGVRGGGTIKVLVEHHSGTDATPAFTFKNVPAPSKDDAGSTAKFTVVDGKRDAKAGQIGVLNDGKWPESADQPSASFFFNQGLDGGRIGVDLGDATAIGQVNTYSWHKGSRGPQNYKLYAADGKAQGFNAAPKLGTEPEKSGWTLVARVDTRPTEGEAGGQYGVNISAPEGDIGTYRYLLFEVFQNEDDDQFGNTFFSEIDVVAAEGAKTGGGRAGG